MKGLYKSGDFVMELVFQRDSALKNMCAKLVKENSLKMEGVLEKRLVELMRQALLSGDFQMCVDLEGSVVGQADYIPYRRVSDLETKVKELRKRLRDISELSA